MTETMNGEHMLIKRTGVDAASKEEQQAFDNYCTEDGINRIYIIVTDDEHESLSLDANVQFIYPKNATVYPNIMRAYKDLVPEGQEPNVELMFELNVHKFDQNPHAKAILMLTDGVIVYKTEDDNYWGSRVPQFDGQNVAGHLLGELCAMYRNIE